MAGQGKTRDSNVAQDAAQDMAWITQARQALDDVFAASDQAAPRRARRAVVLRTPDATALPELLIAVPDALAVAAPAHTPTAHHAPARTARGARRVWLKAAHRALDDVLASAEAKLAPAA